MAPESERAKKQVICNDCLGRSGGHTARCPHWLGSKDAMGCEECGKECNARHPGHDGKLRCFECNEKSPLGYGKPSPAAAENSEQPLGTSDGQTNPNEPTLTCSEVVERLRCRVIHVDYAKGTSCIDKRSEAIDHPERYAADFREELIAKKHYCNDCYATDQIEWRERRVQELEELLREIFYDVRQGAIPNHGDPWFAKSERALAKHSLSPEPLSTQPDANRGKE